LPYELVVDGALNAERNRFVIRFEARSEQFGKRAAGSPFVVYARSRRGDVEVRDYAVTAGSHLEDWWALGDFENGVYHLSVHGPNGFYRQFVGSADDPPATVRLIYDRRTPSASALSGNLTIEVTNPDVHQACNIAVRDNAYREADIHRAVEPSGQAMLPINTKAGLGWYDLSIRVDGKEPFVKRYAGRTETGDWGYSDPFMGRVVDQVSAINQGRLIK
jgi:phospholipase C